MARKKVPAGLKKNDIINVRVSPAEHAMINALAELSGMKLGQFIRAAIYAQVGKHPKEVQALYEEEIAMVNEKIFELEGGKEEPEEPESKYEMPK